MKDIGGRFGINTYSYTQAMTATACVRHLASLGVQAVELMFYPGHIWIDASTAERRELRDAAAASGVDILTMNTPNIDLNIAAATQEMRKLSLDINIEYLRLTGEIGARALILGPGKANPLFPLPKATLDGYLLAALDALLPVAEASGVEIWLENQPFSYRPDAVGLIDMLGRYDKGQLRICYDVANAHFIGEDPLEGIAQTASRLALIHMSDTGRAAYRHDPVGQGDIDFARLAKAVTAATPGTPPVLEIISEQPDEALAQSCAALEALGF